MRIATDIGGTFTDLVSIDEKMVAWWQKKSYNAAKL